MVATRKDDGGGYGINIGEEEENLSGPDEIKRKLVLRRFFRRSRSIALPTFTGDF